MDAEASRFDVGRGEQICAVSCMGDGAAYCWSVLDWRSRHAIGFRGFSANFSPAPVAREVIDFTLAGPLIGCLFDLECFVEPQAVEMGGSLGTAPSLLVFEAKGLVAPSPQRSPDGVGPRDAIVSLTNDREGVTVATVADIRLRGGWIGAVLVAAIPALALSASASVVTALMFGSEAGALVVKVTTPIGTVAVNRPFTTAPGLPAPGG